MVSLTAALKYEWLEPSACFGSRSTVHLYCGCRRLAPTNGQVPSRSLVHLIKSYDSCCRLAITAPTGGQGEAIARPSINAEWFFCCLTDAIGEMQTRAIKRVGPAGGTCFFYGSLMFRLMTITVRRMSFSANWRDPFLLVVWLVPTRELWRGTTVWCASTRRRGQSCWGWTQVDLNKCPVRFHDCQTRLTFRF